MEKEQLKETLKEFIQRDPYIAFFIEFFSDIGIEPLRGRTIKNTTTNTTITARSNTIIITQDGKQLSIPLKQAQTIVEELYGRISLSILPF